MKGKAGPSQVSQPNQRLNQNGHLVEGLARSVRLLEQDLRPAQVQTREVLSHFPQRKEQAAHQMAKSQSVPSRRPRRPRPARTSSCSPTSRPYNSPVGTVFFLPARFEVNVSETISSLLGTARAEDKEKSCPYLIVRSLKNSEGTQKGYSLNVGDVLKMGRMEYSVLQICNDKEVLRSATESLELIFSKEFNRIYEVPEGLKGACRFCLMEEESPENFMVAPCNCKGSCGLIHISCLKMWMGSKLMKKTNTATLINFTRYECEICKQAMPSTVIKGAEHHYLFSIERPQNKPYIILQSLAHKGQKYFHILQASKDIIKIGRGHECEVRMTDISVSRTHAQIKYENGHFTIFDNHSKFGTLIKVKNNLTVTGERVAVQVGRTVITFMLRQKEQAKEKTKTMNSFPSFKMHTK